jgi:hypothetical protein
MARPALAYALAIGGDTARAKAVLDCVHLDDYQRDALGSERLPLLVMLAHAVAMTPATALAPALYRTLLPHRDRHAIDGIGGYFVGSVERPLGLLAALNGDLDDSAQHIGTALALHRRLRAQLLVAGTLRDAATALADHAMRKEAEALFATLALPDPWPPERHRGHGLTNTFRRDGDGWLVGLSGSAVRMGHTKGMADIARLLARPGTEMHVLDMVADGPTLASAPAGDAIDDEARRSYQARLAGIDAEMADADERGDAIGSDRLHVEPDLLIAELSAAYGLGGRSRRRGDSAERARSTVTKRLRDAITRIGAVDSGLGQHLRRSVRTGTYCSYAPEHPIEWVL